MATGTQVDVVMPQMGVSVSEGTITKWLKQTGDAVEQDEPLLEISTDKVDTEVPSPGAGVLQQILVPEGETVEVGTRLAVIAPEGSAAAPPPPQAAPAPPPPAAPAPAPPAEGAGAGETVEPMSAMRKGIADHMRRSLDTSAHVTSAIEVDLTRLVEIRAKLKREY